MELKILDLEGKEEGKIKLQMKADLEVIFYSLNELERLLEIR